MCLSLFTCSDNRKNESIRETSWTVSTNVLISIVKNNFEVRQQTKFDFILFWFNTGYRSEHVIRVEVIYFKIYLSLITIITWFFVEILSIAE